MVAAGSLSDEVRARARGLCEYCQLPESAVEEQFHIDHIRARQHRGLTVSSNLALACSQCNLHKGTNLSGVDPQSDQVVILFHPRTDRWSEHFRWQGPLLLGITDVGRATLATLQMNSPERIQLREFLIKEGLLSITPRD